MRTVRMTPTGPLRGALRAPASKSVTNRLLVLAALAEGSSALTAPLESDDSAAMRACITALGADVSGDGVWKITGTAGTPRSPSAPLDARLSGTTARFITAVVALTPRGGVVDGLGPLRRRPIAPLVHALAAVGAEADSPSGGLPVSVAGGGLDGGAVDVDVSGSSQFASALLMVAPYARHDVVCRLHGRAADDYIALTAALMAQWGADVTHDGAQGSWQVRAGAGYRARSVEVEYDASAAAHLFAMGIASGGAVTVTNVARHSHQPDAGLPDVFAQMGCDVVRDGSSVTVAGGDLRPIDVSLAAMPDQVTTLAVLAALAPGTSVLRDVGVARLHETDRLAALAAELGKVGVQVIADPNSLVIYGGTARGPAILDTYDDHRLAMAFAALGTKISDIAIADPGCVAKTYPEFWQDVARLGAGWREQE